MALPSSIRDRPEPISISTRSRSNFRVARLPQGAHRPCCLLLVDTRQIPAASLSRRRRESRLLRPPGAASGIVLPAKLHAADHHVSQAVVGSQWGQQVAVAAPLGVLPMPSLSGSPSGTGGGLAGTDRRPPRPPMALTARRSHGRGRRRPRRLRGFFDALDPAGTVGWTGSAASVYVRPVSTRRTACMSEEFDDGEPGTVYGVTTRDAGRCRRALQPGILSTRMPVRRCVLRRITRSATSRSRCK
jgi:hypothetical protein